MISTEPILVHDFSDLVLQKREYTRTCGKNEHLYVNIFPLVYKVSFKNAHCAVMYEKTLVVSLYLLVNLRTASALNVHLISDELLFLTVCFRKTFTSNYLELLVELQSKTSRMHIQIQLDANVFTSFFSCLTP